jgi:hypothetical protein
MIIPLLFIDASSEHHLLSEMKAIFYELRKRMLQQQRRQWISFLLYRYIKLFSQSVKCINLSASPPHLLVLYNNNINIIKERGREEVYILDHQYLLRRRSEVRRSGGSWSLMAHGHCLDLLGIKSSIYI